MNELNMKHEKQKQLIEAEYVRRLRQNRTTLFLLVLLYFKGLVSFNYALDLLFSPAEFSLFNNQALTEDEEQLSSGMGLRLLYQGAFVTWDGYLIFEAEGRAQFKKYKIL